MPLYNIQLEFVFLEDNTDKADKDIMKLYTFLKPKPSTTDRKQNRTSTQSCGLSRKRKIKTPFRLDNVDDTVAEQQSRFAKSARG